MTKVNKSLSSLAMMIVLASSATAIYGSGGPYRADTFADTPAGSGFYDAASPDSSMSANGAGTAVGGRYSAVVGMLGAQYATTTTTTIHSGGGGGHVSPTSVTTTTTPTSTTHQTTTSSSTSTITVPTTVISPPSTTTPPTATTLAVGDGQEIPSTETTLASPSSDGSKDPGGDPATGQGSASRGSDSGDRSLAAREVANCGNGVMDGDEEGADCGGHCRPCGPLAISAVISSRRTVEPGETFILEATISGNRPAMDLNVSLSLPEHFSMLHETTRYRLIELSGDEIVSWELAADEGAEDGPYDFSLQLAAPSADTTSIVPYRISVVSSTALELPFVTLRIPNPAVIQERTFSIAHSLINILYSGRYLYVSLILALAGLTYMYMSRRRRSGASRLTTV